VVGCKAPAARTDKLQYQGLMGAAVAQGVDTPEQFTSPHVTEGNVLLQGHVTGDGNVVPQGSGASSRTGAALWMQLLSNVGREWLEKVSTLVLG